MVLYNWRNNVTGEEFENNLTMADHEIFKKEHPELTQLITKFTPVSGVGGIKTDDSFKDVLANIAKKNPYSSIRV